MDLLEEVVTIVSVADRHGVKLRALGGVAVRMRCASMANPWLEREYGDIDLLGLAHDWKSLDKVLGVELGYVPNLRFNALNAGRQMLYDSPEKGIHVDVFLDVLRMCHELPLQTRLGWHAHTLSLSDLLLSKLQVVELTMKDIRDIVGLLLQYPVAAHESEYEIGLDRLVSGCARDWGWWRTVKGSIEACRSAVPTLAPAEEAAIVLRALGVIEAALDATPKSLGWRARARVGERVRWYESPEAAH
jgi:hypothetical protein